MLYLYRGMWGRLDMHGRCAMADVLPGLREDAAAIGVLK